MVVELPATLDAVQETSFLHQHDDDDGDDDYDDDGGVAEGWDDAINVGQFGVGGESGDTECEKFDHH